MTKTFLISRGKKIFFDLPSREGRDPKTKGLTKKEKEYFNSLPEWQKEVFEKGEWQGNGEIRVPDELSKTIERKQELEKVTKKWD